jgi:6-phosphofructokinase 1
MAGFTNFTTGLIKGVSAYIPIECIARSTQSVIEQGDRNWQRLLASTGQPDFLNDKEEEIKI